MKYKKQKILVVLGEKFYYENGKYHTNQTSGKFVLEAFPDADITFCSHLINKSGIDHNFSVDDKKFETLPYYDSIKDFAVKSIINPTFLIRYIKSCNDILDKYPDALVWARNPSIGCLIFSLCSLKKKRYIINHMCANTMLGWSNKKYNKVEQIVGYLLSLILKKMVIKTVSNNRTLNLCTGDELYNFCYKLNKDSYQFVDLMAEKIDVNKDNNQRDRSKLKLLYVGRLEKDKGVGELCQAVSDIDENYIQLDVIGGGGDRELEKIYFSKKNIIFHGPLKHVEVSSFLENCDVLVAPSTNLYEGFPRVIMEAWCHHKPVIVSNVGGVKAFVKHGVNGVLVPAGDVYSLRKEIIHICDDDYFNRLKLGALKMASISNKYYWQKMVSSLVHSWMLVKNKE
ncbi:glycosyltransferase family 4 protein [Citrobacter freundii]|uniref:glycosyltransferase family 4 protein n=1 Tax=Citrobacter freundii TaxID=546 RepID=UPI0008421E5F|nr:glycosyltransferase family 4 protein [Citrobacter freundii]AOI30829.1 hypothetical protein BFQ28_13705 [Citrobacter freundii]MBA8562500.1 glycosyltransferase family 4 protein [Citrobacter freundii]